MRRLFQHSERIHADLRAVPARPHGLQTERLMADSEGSHAPRSPFRVWHAFIWSMKGLRATWSVESSFRLEVYLFVVLLPLALWLGKDGIERAILAGSMMLVLIIEVLNSAVEAVVDRWGLELHELAGRAKDMGSAAVFLSDMNVLLCWGLILGPRYLS
jgi:diacylglycerol kinase (ATP)